MIRELPIWGYRLSLAADLHRHAAHVLVLEVVSIDTVSFLRHSQI